MPVKNRRKISSNPPLSFLTSPEVLTKERHCVYVTGSDDGLVSLILLSLSYN